MAVSAIMNRGIVLLLLSTSVPAFAAKVLPVLNHPLPDIQCIAGQAATTIPVGPNFATEAIDDQAVRFTSQFSSAGVPVVMDMALFSNRTPLTRTNFLAYVNSNKYVRSFIHRSVPGFVIQGGGFYLDSSNDILPIATNPPVQNEFGISNTYGTVSMAKTGGNPNSATSQWFVSIGDNSANLDAQNGGFTVFARVTKSTVGNAGIFGDPNAFMPTDISGNFLPTDPFYSASQQVPLYNGSGSLIVFPQVALVPVTDADAGTSTALTYTMVSSGASGAATVSFPNNAVTIAPSATQTGKISVKVTATDSVGNTVDDTFVVSVVASYATWRTATFPAADASNDAVSGPAADPDGDGITNLELFLHGLPLGATSKPPVTSADFNDGTARHPRFTFPIRNDITGVSYVIEKTATLTDSASWTTAPMTEISRTTAATIDTVTIQPTDAVSATPVFYRVRFALQ
jgi:peptidyl-prolyl cis-trans isomerase A (cyclophilin A)